MKKYFKKTICSLIILSMIVMPLFVLTPKKAEAQNSLSGYITSLTPVIAKMPGCTKAIGSGITDLFNSVKKLFSSKEETLEKVKFTAPTEATFDEINAIDTTDAQANKTLGEVKKIATATNTAVKNQDKNQNCLNGIGKAIAKVLINRLTDSTINWINTGFSGDPLYIQDPGAYFKDIAKSEMLGFFGEINNPTLYPFGKAFIQAQTNSFNNKFANNATYSLNKMIQDENPGFSDQTFAQDFSQGGWGAWDAMTQNAANNPLGFALMASNELAKRIEDKTQLAEGSLQQSGGFLGVEQCVNPKDVTKQEDDAGRKERASSDMGPYQNRICNKWQTVTPGKLIGDQLVSAVDKKDNALLDVQTLNDAMAAILDAVLAKFSSSLQSESEGLFGVTTGDYYSINQGINGIGNFQTGSDYSNTQINASTWLSDHPDFDIRTDLNQALIDEQRIYQDKLKEQNKELMSEITPDPDKKETSLGNYGLIPTIYQLDYCVPGPHPGWEDDAQQAVSDIQSKMGSLNFADMTESGWFKFLDSLSLGTIGSTINLVNSFVFKCGTDSGNQAAKTYMGQFDGMTHMDDSGAIKKGKTDNLSFCSVVGFDLATDRAESEYERVIKKFYDLKYLPSSAPEAKTEFGKIDGYTQIMNDNLKTIDVLTGIITRLNDVKSKIDGLNCQLDSASSCTPHITQDEYENGNIDKEIDGIIPWKNAFARISASLYSGDDIAMADSLTKQIVDEKDYVYKNLLTGATGCEAEVSKNNPAAINWQVYFSVRPDYPKPHLYDYPGRLFVDGTPNSFISPIATEKTFTHNTLFITKENTITINGVTGIPQDITYGATCDTTSWVADCFDMANYIDTKYPHKGGSGYWWEQSIGMW